MSGNVVLDTNIVISLLRHDTNVVKRVGEQDSVAIPIVVAGELYYGALRSRQPMQNVAIIDAFLAGSSVLIPDEETAKQYGTVKSQLASKGRPIPENDVWIAALAIQHGLTVVSHDVHFSEVDGLSLESWQA